MARNIASAVARPDPDAPDILIVLEHRRAGIFQIDISSDDASEHSIRPHAPHHVLHHLAHKEDRQKHDREGREEPAYYDKIAGAVAPSGRIMVVGHLGGESNAARERVEYLQSHHRKTYERIVHEIDADLAGIMAPQLLVLARKRLSE